MSNLRALGLVVMTDPCLVVAIMSDQHLGLTPNMVISAWLSLLQNIVVRPKALEICANSFSYLKKKR